MSFTNGLFGNAKRVLTENTPAILTGLSVAGTVSTAVLAVMATPQACRDIMDAESERIEPLTWQEKVRLTWKGYIPSAVVGVTTIAATIGAQGINQRRQAALMSMLALTETSYREYKEKTREIAGEAVEGKIKDEIAREHLLEVPMVNSEVIFTGDGDYLCFDSMSSRYFRSDQEVIRKAVNDANERCLSGDTVSLNDFYNMIGIPPVKFGDDTGWRYDHTLKIHYSTFMSDHSKQIPTLCLDFETAPMSRFWKINP